MNEDDFPEIDTGNGFSNNLAATANDRLKKVVIEINGLKSAVSKLEKTIVSLNSENGKLQRQIFWLTIIGVVLAATQIVQVLDTVKNWL